MDASRPPDADRIDSVLAKIERVCVASQAAVTGQESRECQPLSVGEHRRNGTRAVDGVVVVIGHLRGRAETRRLDLPRSQRRRPPTSATSDSPAAPAGGLAAPQPGRPPPACRRPGC